MDNSEIKNLLEKYYSGETTIEEEKALKEYLLSDDVASEFASEKEIFLSLSQAELSIEIPEDLNDNLSKMIDNLDKKSSPKRIKLNFFIKYGAAAVILVALVLVTFLPERKMPQNIYTANVKMSEEEAMAMFEESMMLMSKGFEKSFSTAKEAGDMVEKTIETVVNSVK